MRLSAAWFLGVFVLLASTGCAAKPVPTKGTLLVGGKPLANATVLFTPDNAEGKSATGLTDASGAFELRTSGAKDGALPGTYKITIVHAQPAETPKGSTNPEDFQEASMRAAAKPSLIPEMYTRLDQTPLRHRVPEDGDARIDVPRAP